MVGGGGGGWRGFPFFLLDHGNPQSVSICQFVLNENERFRQFNPTCMRYFLIHPKRSALFDLTF